MRRRQNGRRKAATRSFFSCFARLFDLTCEKESERVFDDDEVLLLFQKEVWKNKSLSTHKRKKNTKKRKETFHMVCFVRGVFSFFIKLVCGPQKPLGEQKNHEKKTRALKKSRKREVKNSPEREKSAQKRPKKEGQKKKSGETPLSNSSATRALTDAETTSTARRRKSDAPEEKSDERLDSAKRPFLRSRCRRLDGAALRRRKRHCRRPTMKTSPLPRPNGQIRNSKPNCPARFACCPWKGPRVK